MLDQKIKFKIVTPEKVVFEDEIDQISLPTKMGEITVLANHVPLVSSLNPGEILIKKNKEEIPMAVSGGFVELNNNQMVILADTAERVEEIDVERAEQARQKAKDLLDKKQDADDFINAADQKLKLLKEAKQKYG